jgi:type I restriction enzyme S subunit
MRFDDTCPDDWAFRSIESRCSKITSGGTPSRATPSFYVGNGGIPWVKTKELNNWFIEDTEEHISDEAIRSSSAKMLPKSSVLIAMYGATVGELGILAAPMACNQACCALIINQDTDDERFLFYQLLSRKQDIKNQAVGAAQQNISAQFVRSIELPTPPKAEQKAT